MAVKYHLGQVGIVCTAALSCMGASALESGDPSAFQVGGGFFYPSVGVDLSYDDNIFLQETDEKGSWKTLITPQATLEFEGASTKLTFKAGAELGNYASSHDDDYFDGNVSVDAAYYATQRVTLGLNAGYMKSHEARGTASQSGADAFNFNKPNRYHATFVGASMAYGVDEVGAPRFEVSVRNEDQTYDNNRAQTIFRDRNTKEARASLFYKVMPATSLVLEGRAKKYDYDYVLATLDSKEVGALAGVLWEATALTEGFAKFGVNRKKFTDPLREDTSASAWEVGINWKPMTYSTFTLATTKGFNETDGVGDYVDSREVSLEWQHDWMEYLGTKLSLAYGTDDYGNDPREDDIWRAGLKVDYRLNPGIILGAGYTHSDLDSNAAGYSYKDNVVGVQIGVNM